MDFCSWEPPGLLPELGELRPGNVSVAVPADNACNTVLQLGSDVKGELSAVYMHTFLFQWQPGVSAAMQERAAKKSAPCRGRFPACWKPATTKISPPARRVLRMAE